MSLRIRSITIISLLSLVALGAIALTGLWHPNAPMEAMQKYLPQITLPTVVIAGVVDGINPCAFTVLLLFVTALTSTLQSGEANVKAMRARLLGMGGIYIAAVFLDLSRAGCGVAHIARFLHAPARPSPLRRTTGDPVWAVDA